MNSRSIFTVTQVNSYIRSIMEEDVILSDLFIQGEISNFKRHSSGHLYFTLKDQTAAVNCVMFRSDAYGLDFMPENGMKVTVYGHISLYEKTGQYQLYVALIQEAGVGLLYLEFEKLKKKLADKGYFDTKNKKKIPQSPAVVALVTSPTGAAVRDMVSIIKRRNPSVKIVVAPVLVQGNEAPDSIAGGIEKVNRWGGADVMIVGRGGGSMEDLWAFNDEKVGEAIFRSEVPVVSAVGHETDFTIADFVADIRASTPSAAAELCVPDVKAQVYRLARLSKSMDRAFNEGLSDFRYRFNLAISRPSFKNPLRRVYDSQIYAANLVKQAKKSMDNILASDHEALSHLAARLEASSPVAVIARGYGAVYKNGRQIRSISQAQIGETIEIILSDGRLNAEIKDKAGDDRIGRQ